MLVTSLEVLRRTLPFLLRFVGWHWDVGRAKGVVEDRFISLVRRVRTGLGGGCSDVSWRVVGVGVVVVVSVE